MKIRIARLLFISCLSVFLTDQNTKFSQETRNYIIYEIPHLALTGVRVIVGDGVSVLSNQTIIIREVRIVDIGSADDIPILESAQQIDLRGKTVLPGFIMFHEHMFYPAGDKRAKL